MYLNYGERYEAEKDMCLRHKNDFKLTLALFIYLLIFFLLRQKDPFGELFSEIYFKSSSELTYF